MFFIFLTHTLLYYLFGYFHSLTYSREHPHFSDLKNIFKGQVHSGYTEKQKCLLIYKNQKCATVFSCN